MQYRRFDKAATKQYNGVMILAFDENGNLPPGIHLATVSEIQQRFAYNPQRWRLFDGLIRVLSMLKGCGCQDIYLNGSFVTDEPFPNDYDLCWEPTAVIPTPELRSFLKNRKGRKSRYYGDIFVRLPQPLIYFDHVIEWQKDRNGIPKGLIKILREDEND
jgi:hypothetical protein